MRFSGSLEAAQRAESKNGGKQLCALTSPLCPRIDGIVHEYGHMKNGFYPHGDAYA